MSNDADQKTKCKLKSQYEVARDEAWMHASMITSAFSENNQENDKRIFSIGYDKASVDALAELESLRTENENMRMIISAYSTAQYLLKEKLSAANAQMEKLVEALERIANSRCAWQLSQEISREVLADYEEFKKDSK